MLSIQIGTSMKKDQIYFEIPIDNPIFTLFLHAVTNPMLDRWDYGGTMYIWIGKRRGHGEGIRRGDQ